MPENTSQPVTSVRLGGVSLRIDLNDVVVNTDARRNEGHDGDQKQQNEKNDEAGQNDQKDQKDGKDQKEEKGEKEEKEDPKKKRRKKWLFIGLGIGVLLIFIGALIYLFLTRNLIDTDDAYTDGRAVSMAAKVSGYATTLNVDDNTWVNAGDLLLKIDPRDYITARDQAKANLELAHAQLSSAQTDLKIARVRVPATLKQAQAQLAQARANEANAKREFARQNRVDARATTQSTIDQADATFKGNSSQVESADAQVQIASLVRENIADAEDTVQQRQAQADQMQAALEQAEINLSYTEIRAPQSGRITMRNVELGTYVQVGQQIFYLVTPDTWVVANYKEKQLDGMKPGQPVDMRVDAFPALRLHGHVDSIQQGSGARFSAFPAQNATGNFVKIVRRVPVKIVVDSGIDPKWGLPLGISVRPTVNIQ